MIAARGSGELPQGDGPNGWTVQSAYTTDPDEGAGHELYVLYTALRQAYPALTLDPVMYPADAVFPDLVTGVKVYLQSVASGASTVLTDIQLIDHACGSRQHQYILGGYSQGAWVIHDALHQMTSKQLREISGVALFGDPDFVHSEPWVRAYKLVDIFNGSAAIIDRHNTSIPAIVASRTASYCFQGDPVCQTWAGTIATTLPWCVAGSVANCPHFRYVLDGEVAKAAAFLIPFLPAH